MAHSSIVEVLVFNDPTIMDGMTLSAREFSSHEAAERYLTQLVFRGIRNIARVTGRDLFNETALYAPPPQGGPDASEEG